MQYDLTDFRLFANIAEESNLTRGAARSFLSVPAASQRIRNLEEALGVKLLQRTTQGVAMTDAGRTYLAHARQVLDQLESLTGDLQALGSSIAGTLRVLANTTAINEFLPPVLHEYLGRHRNVKVDLRERLSDEAVRAVRDGAADLGIISGSVPTDGLEVESFATSRLVVIAPAGHPVLARESVAFADLRDEEFVALLDGSATQEFLRLHAQRLHRALKARVQVAGFDAVHRMVEAGVGIAIIPEMVVTPLNAAHPVGVLTLTDRWAIRQYQICARTFDGLALFAREFALSNLPGVFWSILALFAREFADMLIRQYRR